MDYRLTCNSSGFLKQTRFGARGDFYLVLPSVNGGFDSFTRKNDTEELAWVGPHRAGAGQIDAVTMIQSTFGSHIGNLEIVVRSGSKLDFYWCSDSSPNDWFTLENYPDLWKGIRVIGNPAMIQSNLGEWKGNFELVVPWEGGGLVHFSRDNSLPGVPWNGGPTHFGDPSVRYQGVALIQSTLSRPGHLEVAAVTEDGKLVLYWREDFPPYSWHGPVFFAGPGFTGAPCLIQGNFGGKPGNFELVAAVETGGLAHYSRSNDKFGFPWFGPVFFGSGQVSAVSMIQSNFGTIGNLEVVAIEDGRTVHYVRDDFPPYKWYGPISVSPR